MKILLVGHKGLLGSSFLSHVSNLDTTDLRFGDPLFSNFIQTCGYDIIINCAVDKTNNPLVNIELPFFLVEHCDYFIQFSSDAVFSGKKPNHLKYNKQDMPDPVCVYGQQKHEMEKILSTRTNCLIIRTSFIHSSSKLVSDILQQDEFLGFQNYLWSGLTANQVVELTMSCLNDRQTGLCHMFSKDSISKHKVASLVASAYNTKTRITPVEYPIVNRQVISDFDTNFDINRLNLL